MSQKYAYLAWNYCSWLEVGTLLEEAVEDYGYLFMLKTKKCHTPFHQSLKLQRVEEFMALKTYEIHNILFECFTAAIQIKYTCNTKYIFKKG